MADPFVQQQVPAQIGAGQSLSAQVDIGGWTLVGISIPTGWTTAAITFQASADGGTTWAELLDQTATAVSVSSTTGPTFIALDPAKFRGIRSLRARSGTKATPVNQTSAVTLTLLARAVF